MEKYNYYKKIIILLQTNITESKAIKTICDFDGWNVNISQNIRHVYTLRRLTHRRVHTSQVHFRHQLIIAEMCHI